MANFRELRTRIKSVNSTKKITKTQGLIATSRVTKAQCRVADSQPYTDEIEKVIGRLASASLLDRPMLVRRGDNRCVAALAVTSDHGMCDGYNHNVLEKAAELRTALEEQGYEVVLYVTGRRSTSYCDFRDVELTGTWEDFSQDPDYAATYDACRYLIDGFNATAKSAVKYREGLYGTNGETVQGFDQAHVVYTEFVSVLSQIPRAHQILPIEPVYEDVETAQGEDVLPDGSGDLKPGYELGPDADVLLTELLPQYISHTPLAVMLEATASESTAHRNAMKSATDNATESVKDLSRVVNQARQARITQEITEIVSGAGALDDSEESDQM